MRNLTRISPSLTLITDALQERLKALKKGHGKKELGPVTLDMLIGGMRGIPVRLDWPLPIAVASCLLLPL